jgi:hypothetical protein
MAGAIIIVSAIGILLLVLAGYVLVGGNLASADIITSAQKDMAREKVGQMDTAIQISNANLNWQNPNHTITFDLKNIGSAPIGDFNHMDMFILLNEANWIPVRYSFNGASIPGVNESRTWGYLTITPDTTHPSMLDPGETMAVEIDFVVFGNGPHPSLNVVNVTTPNGVTNGSVTP